MGHLTDRSAGLDAVNWNSDHHNPSCTTTAGTISGQGAAGGASLGPRAMFPVPEVTARRCYVCSFCGREFRSAQALGGHMNVHRRERALCAQLLAMRNQQGPKPSGAAAGATAACDMNNTGAEFACGSSSSSCSPPSPHAQVSTSMASPWGLQPPFENPLARHCSVDLELRLGLTPKK